MTTFALVAGMLPMALGTGVGSGVRRSVAIIVIGGQMLCLLLTLLAIPVAYSLFDDLATSPMWARTGVGSAVRRGTFFAGGWPMRCRHYLDDLIAVTS